MRRLSLTLTSISLILLILQAGSSPAAAKDTWTNVRSKNFFLVGNASEKEIRQVATKLEQFRDVFSRLFANLQFSSSVPTTVVVFRSDSSYRPFKTNPNVAGYFQSGDDVNYITLTTEQHQGDGPFRTIFHEYVHLLVNNTLGHTVPAWFNEGLAEYYSTFDVADDARKVILGNLISSHVLHLREQKLIPLRTLFAVDHDSPYYNEANKMNVFYAESWILVHYVIQGNKGQRREQLGRFLNLLNQNIAAEDAFKQAFSVSFEEMERELKSYIRGASFMATTATFPQRLKFDSEMQSAPLSEAEAEAYLGDLLLHTQRLTEAETRLQRALALDPALALAHASLGLLRVRQGRIAEAKQSLQRAVAANSQNYLAHYYYALALSGLGNEHNQLISSYPAETAQTMRAELKKAIELKPDFPESYNLLAFVDIATGGQLDESIGLLKHALSLSPGRQHLFLMLAQVYMAKEDYKTAQQVLEGITRSNGEPQVRQQAQKLLDQLTAREEQLGRFDERGDSASQEGSGSPPRLARDNAGSSGTAGAGNSQPATVDSGSYLREALRKPADGETRLQGILVGIECNNRGITLVIKAGDRVVRLKTDSFEDIDITTFTTSVSGEIICGPRKTEDLVVVCYLASKAAGAKVDGVAKSIEFVPNEFKLK